MRCALRAVRARNRDGSCRESPSETVACRLLLGPPDASRSTCSDLSDACNACRPCVLERPRLPPFDSEHRAPRRDRRPRLARFAWQTASRDALGSHARCKESPGVRRMPRRVAFAAEGRSSRDARRHALHPMPRQACRRARVRHLPRIRRPRVPAARSGDVNGRPRARRCPCRARRTVALPLHRAAVQHVPSGSRSHGDRRATR